MRLAWLALGCLMVALGVIGALLPVMPTTIFLILAAGCFARSSPRLESWLLNHPRFGATLRQWREQGAISRKGKLCAVAGMALGYGGFAWGAHPSWWLGLGTGLGMLACATWVVSRPLPAPHAAPFTGLPSACRRPGA
ncbi:YbaN family protein [Achromobacter pestifer]|uniref:YbaN family protein n=1 Tax=Achromobacter pestifer TaxID=1353889 RepID=A0A6S6ZJS3_9BURK|nr:YbaN family protein [Achromobacter pestifer]CAB3678831.1 hypothetical protein LMG3431_04253 [Achromobacter pestifer]